MGPPEWPVGPESGGPGMSAAATGRQKTGGRGGATVTFANCAGHAHSAAHGGTTTAWHPACTHTVCGAVMHRPDGHATLYYPAPMVLTKGARSLDLALTGRSPVSHHQHRYARRGGRTESLAPPCAGEPRASSPRSSSGRRPERYYTRRRSRCAPLPKGRTSQSRRSTTP